MASKVMPSASTTPNSDHSRSRSRLPQNPTPPSSSSSLLHSDPSRNFGSMNMDELLNNIYSDSPDPFCSASETTAPTPAAAGGDGRDVGPSKTVDEVWREIVSGGGGGGGGGGGCSREPEMTLEDFLTKAGAVTEEDVRVPVIAPPPATAAPVAGGFVVDNMGNCQFPMAMQNGPLMGFGNGVVAIAGSGSGSGGSGRGKRRSTVEELPLDKATQQKQRRMIKNRESAARSRERKQVPFLLLFPYYLFFGRFGARIETCMYVFTEIAGVYCGIGVFGYSIGGGKCKAFERRG